MMLNIGIHRCLNGEHIDLSKIVHISPPTSWDKFTAITFQLLSVPVRLYSNETHDFYETINEFETLPIEEYSKIIQKFYLDREVRLYNDIMEAWIKYKEESIRKIDSQ